MTVCSRDKSPVRQYFHTGVSAIPFIFIVHDAHSILPLASIENVVISADPADPITLCGTILSHIAEADEKTAVRRIFCGVAIASEAGREFTWRCPCFAFILRNYYVRVFSPRIF